jgi:predicted DNA-binding transcriptional regulator AlpA
MELLSLAETLVRTGLSRRTFFRVRERGEFPQPLRFGHTRVVLWRSDDVDTWVQANKPARVQRDP